MRGRTCILINVRQTLTKKTTDEAFRTMAGADAMIIIFPLYVFCLPGITMRFLELYRDYAAALPARKQPGVYAVVNCGFPEPDINEEAACVVHRFADAIGARFCYGVLIGGGGDGRIKYCAGAQADGYLSCGGRADESGD